MNGSPHTLYQLLYCSRLAHRQPVTAVTGIVRSSRMRNERRDISSLLVFDGERFCQYLEGPRHAIGQLATRIAPDPRHVDYRICHHGPIGQRRFGDWQLAYGLAGEPQMLDGVEQAPSGPAAIDQLVALLPLLEIDS